MAPWNGPKKQTEASFVSITFRSFIKYNIKLTVFKVLLNSETVAEKL